MLAYVNAKALILDYIRQNKLKRGDRLPTEADLSKQLEIGRMSLREGLNALKNEGIILSVQGSGTFVACDLEHIADALNVNCSVTDMIKGGGHKPGCCYFSKEIIKADARVASALHIVEGPDVPVCTRIRTADDVPVVFMRDYFAPALAPLFLEFNENVLSLYEYIEQHSSYKVGASMTEIMPCAADAEQAKALSVPQGTLLLEMINIVNDVYGTPIIFAQEYFLADRFKFIITRGKA